MARQQRFHWLQQFRAGKQIEEGVGIAVGGTAANTLLLMQTGPLIRMHTGWSLR
jgi:hypothetical protein